MNVQMDRQWKAYPVRMELVYGPPTGGVTGTVGDNRAFRKRLASAAVIFFFMEVNRLFNGPLLKMGLDLLIGVTFSGILIIPKSWWTRTRFVLASSIIMVEATIGVIWFQEMKLIYFVAIFILAAAIHLSLSKSPIPAMAVMFVTAVLYIRFGHEDLINLFSFGLLASVVYMNIRHRMQRNEMYEANKRHLTELQEAYEQLQEASVTSMQYAVLEERGRIAREIHDAVGHSLTSLIVQIQALRYMIKKDPHQAEQTLEGMLIVARQGLHDIRTSVHSLADDQSNSGVIPLKALLSRMETSASIRYTFHDDIGDADVAIEIYGTLFKVLQEAITNVIRHSQANLLEVSLVIESGNLMMRIRDNGILAASHKINEGFGLKAMRARLKERGGSLRFSIAEPHGFEMVAEIPIAKQAQAHLHVNEKDG